MKINIIILNLFIISFLFLSVQSALANHFQRYNEQIYAQQLQKRQQQFQKQMKHISQQVQDLDKILSKYQGNDTYQLMKLQQGLADQRDSLFDAQKSLNQPFTLKPCQKPNLTEQQKAQLNKQIKTTNDSLNSMKASLKQCRNQIGECTVTNDLNNEIIRSRMYLKVMNEYVNGECLRVPRPIVDEIAIGLVDLNDRLYKDNLKAPNWVYGNITQEQYRLKVFAQTTKFNTTTCPLEAPYANKVNNTCSNCPQGSIFALGQRVCTCGQGFKFDQQIYECVSLTPIIPCNQTGTCVSRCPKDKPRWNNTNKICEKCPNDLPVVNSQNNTCESCPIKSPIWNLNTYQCQSCPQKMQYSRGNCIPCKDDQKFNETSYKCVSICQNGSIYNKNEGKCYSLQEINGCKCNQRYNNTSKQCEDYCQNGLQWISKEQKCGSPSLPDYKDKCKYYQRQNPENGQCEDYCDRTVAWYDRVNHVCIKIGCSVQCKCKQIFDNTTAKCIPEAQQCPLRQFFNTTSQKCQIVCSKELVYNQKTQACQSPLSSGINCKNDEILDLNTKICVKKCDSTKNLLFDNTSKKCECLDGYVSSTRDPLNCLIDSITCPQEKNMTFNTQTQKCQCLDQFHFDNSTKTCIPNPIECDKTLQLVYDKEKNNCVCRQGFTMNIQGACVSICPLQTNMIYNYTSKQCVCKFDYYISPDAKYCLHISQKCQSANNMFFNSTTKSCQCNVGYYMTNNSCLPESSKCSQTLHFVYNSTTKLCQCQPNYLQSADKSRCYSSMQICLKNPNTIYNSQTLKCQCISGFNLVNKTEDILSCVSICKIDQVYNLNSKTCVSLCPNEYYYDLTTHSCLYRCLTDYKYNNVTKQCQKIVKICPDPVNQYLDNKTNQCRYCPTDFVLNKATLVCQKVTQTCQSDQFYDSTTGLCQYCKKGQIFNKDKKQCEFISTTCSSGFYFDFNAGECKTCPAGTIYDQSILQCRAVCTSDQVFDYVSKKCVLISLTCSSYQYYDSSSKTCANKPVCSTIQRYDEATRKCISISYITSKSAKSLIHENFTQWSLDYDKKKSLDKYLQDCPLGSQFYSSALKSCVYCPDTHPLFNLITEKCQNCGSAKYDSALRKCIQQKTSTSTVPNLDYSLDRLVMNII